MAAVKCTCPECNLTFPAPASALGTITCPICDTNFQAPSSHPRPVMASPVVRASSLPEPTPRGRPLLVKVVAVAAVVYLVGGGALAVYFLKSGKTGNQPGPTQTAANTPTSAPATEPPRQNPGPMPPIPEVTETVPPRPLTEEEIKVNEAIDKGVQYLRASLTAFHSNPMGVDQYREGVASLLGLTLLECGVPAKDPDLQKVAEYLRKQEPEILQTYSLSLAILFLDRLGDSRNTDLIQKFAMRLVAGQTGAGGWDYRCPALSAEEEQKLLALLRAVKNSDLPPREKPAGIDQLPPNLREFAVVRVLNGHKQAGYSGDNSNVQFAVLALWVALRQGLPVQPTLTLTDRYFRSTQNREGSWGYVARNTQWRSSMTCAGLLGLAVGRGVNLKENAEREKDEAIERGLRYLGKTVAAKPVSGIGGNLIGADAMGDLYYLWSLERVAMIYDLKTFAGKDWYAWASKVLLGAQQADGSWQEKYPGPIDTSFALLVLKRVNVVKDLTTNIKKAISIKDVEAER